MSKVKLHPNVRDRKPGDQEKSIPSQTHKPIWQYLLDTLIIIGMGVLLYQGALVRILAGAGEPIRYRCYAQAFWNGANSLGSLRSTDCSFIVTDPPTSLIHHMQSWHLPDFFITFVQLQSPFQPFHALPREYPLLAIIPFTLTLLAPYQWFLLEFAAWMTLVAGVLYLVLKYNRSTGAAIAFAFYLVVGNWATALARFDLIPVGLTLGAVILAERSRWRWAFALLALAVLLKFYALVLIPPLFIAQQLQNRGNKWYAMRRWDGMVTLVAVCVVVMAISFLLNVEGTLIPFTYFGSRPVQVESLAAAFLWLGSFLGYQVHYVYTFGSLNAISSLSSKVSLLSTLAFIAGLLYTYWLQWRGKLDIATASLLALLISMITGKIFSPQYLMWVAPFVAYIGVNNWKWLASWGLVCVVTTCIYPYIYTYAPDSLAVPKVPLFYPLVLLRGVIILAIIFVLFYRAALTLPGVPRFWPRCPWRLDKTRSLPARYRGQGEPGARR